MGGTKRRSDDTEVKGAAANTGAAATAPAAGAASTTAATTTATTVAAANTPPTAGLAAVAIDAAAATPAVAPAATTAAAAPTPVAPQVVTAATTTSAPASVTAPTVTVTTAAAAAPTATATTTAAATATAAAAVPTAAASSSSSSSSAAAAAGSKQPEAPKVVVAEDKDFGSKEKEGDLLDEKTVAGLKKLLFGDKPVATDVERWHGQGFTFSKNPKIPWGLTQLHGGPCGILAPVNAYVVKRLLFDPESKDVAKSNDGSECPLNPTEKQSLAALFRVLANLLELSSQNGGSGSFSIVTGNEYAHFLRRRTFTKAADVELFYSEHLPLLASKTGVLLFVYSLLLSRGVSTVIADMDDAGNALVARFGHCSQELVNLVITGRATSNVFDGRKVLDGNPDDPNAYALKGISTVAEIGFLTLLEALRLSKVGNNYKTPRHPIWVVGSTSHYTFCFSIHKNVGQVTEKEALEQKSRAIFNELDPNENGFITKQQIKPFLTKLGLPDSPAAVESATKDMSTDGLDIILWTNVVTALASMANNPAWDCPSCTYHNGPTIKICEMCTTARPAAAATSASASAAAAKKASDSKSPRDFTIYHYNGIDGHGKAVAECRRVRMSIIADNVTNGIDTMKPGLREALQTKWPNAIIEYVEKGEPKII